MIKQISMAVLVLGLSACGNMFEMTIVRKDVVESYKEYVDCRDQPGCGNDGFIEVERPKCYRLGFSDLGGEILGCYPKRVWDRSEVGEVWNSNTLQEKSKE